MSVEEPTMDDLTLMDYVGAQRFLEAYARELNETMVLRSGDARESADIYYQVTNQLSTSIKEVFQKREDEVKFNKIVANESWEGP